jgi:hypothetical protein
MTLLGFLLVLKVMLVALNLLHLVNLVGSFQRTSSISNMAAEQCPVANGNSCSRKLCILCIIRQEAACWQQAFLSALLAVVVVSPVMICCFE